MMFEIVSYVRTLGHFGVTGIQTERWMHMLCPYYYQIHAYANFLCCQGTQINLRMRTSN